nr:hypothetical protein [Tanacetum cinerariifolium]
EIARYKCSTRKAQIVLPRKESTIHKSALNKSGVHNNTINQLGVNRHHTLENKSVVHDTFNNIRSSRLHTSGFEPFLNGVNNQAK